MVVRLVLMGAVAGLGLTLPGRQELGAWGRSAERWVNARLAEWDTQAPIDEAAFVFAADAIGPASAPAVSDDKSDGAVGDMAVAFAQDVAPVATKRSDAPVVEAPATAPAPETSETREIALPAESPAPAAEDAPALEAPAVAPTPAPAVAVASAEPMPVADRDKTFGAVVDELAATFAADLAARPGPTRADEGFADIVEEMAQAFAADAIVVADARPAQPFEPMEIGDDFYKDVAHALNRTAEGLDATSQSASPAAEAPAPEDRLTTAVRLTREAVFAWASLLHGPAVVTISR